VCEPLRHAELKAAWGAIYAAEAVAPKVREPGRLPASLVPLVYLRVALINGCPF
jgi:alkylhydroperoxidase family enzyme